MELIGVKARGGGWSSVFTSSTVLYAFFAYVSTND